MKQIIILLLLLTISIAASEGTGEGDGVGNGEDNGVGNGEDNGVGNGEDNGVGNGEDNGEGNGEDNGEGNGEDNGEDNGFLDGDNCIEQDGPIGCSDDCSSQKICLNGQLKHVKCPKSSLGLPTYCNSVNSKCDLKKKCENTENNFKCPGKGAYPHLFNCHKLFMCAKRGDKGVLKTCGTLKKYDPASGTCVAINLCYNFSPIFGLCFGKNNRIVVHPQNKKYYVHCNASPTLGSCPEGHTFNTKTLSCEYKCTKSGLFADEKKKNCYYKCTWSLFKYNHEAKCCDGEDVFNDKLKMCGPDISRKLQI